MPQIELADGTLSYHEYGEGFPLLLLHGEFLSRATWRPQINAYANRFRVITCDLRGHGESLVTPEPYSVQRYAEDVLTLMDALAIERVLVCGHALGGMVAQELAIRQPTRIDAIVLADTTYNLRATWFEALGSQLQKWAGLEALLKRYAELDCPASVRDDLHREVARHMRQRENSRNIREAMLSFNNHDRLSQIRCLTLILVSEGNQMLHRPARVMNEAIKGSFYGVVLGARQMPHWDNPALFNGITLEFLEGAAALNA